MCSTRAVEEDESQPIESNRWPWEVREAVMGGPNHVLQYRPYGIFNAVRAKQTIVECRCFYS